MEFFASQPASFCFRQLSQKFILKGMCALRLPKSQQINSRFCITSCFIFQPHELFFSSPWLFCSHIVDMFSPPKILKESSVKSSLSSSGSSSLHNTSPRLFTPVKNNDKFILSRKETQPQTNSILITTHRHLL